MNTLLARLSIKHKLYLLTCTLMLFLAICILVSIAQMEKIGKQIVAIAEQDIPLTNVVTQVTVGQLEQAINFERAVRYGVEMQDNATAASQFKVAVNKFNKYSKTVNKEIRHGKELALDAKNHAYNDAAYQEFDYVEKMLKQIDKEHKSFDEHVHEIFTLLQKGELHKALEKTEKVEHEEGKIDKELESLLFELEKFTEEAALTAEHDEKSAVKLLILIAIVAILVSGIMAFFIVRNLSTGVKLMVDNIDNVNAIAKGDLTKPITVNSKDEVGQLLGALETMRSTLQPMIKEMKDNALQLASASAELTDVNEQTTQNLHAQQTEVEQVVTAVNEMAATVQEVSRNAASTSETAQAANDTTSNGYRVVQQTINSISELASGVESAATVLHELEQHSESIGGVLDVIKGIAEQTNLLALNAAIEAARAGEQGRGFAVVADEVRTLASRTQESTTEIEEMIAKLQSGAHQAVETMENGREKATDSVEQANQAGAALEEITGAVSSISDMNTQIASAAEEQAVVADEINKNITTISSLGEQNATGANRTTEAARALSQIADQQQAMVEYFVI